MEGQQPNLHLGLGEEGQQPNLHPYNTLSEQKNKGRHSEDKRETQTQQTHKNTGITTTEPAYTIENNTQTKTHNTSAHKSEAQTQ